MLGSFYCFCLFMKLKQQPADFIVEEIRKLLRWRDAEAGLVPRQAFKELGVIENPLLALRVGVGGEAGGTFAVFEEQTLGVARFDQEPDPLARGVKVLASRVDAERPGAELRSAARDHCGANLARNLAGVGIGHL